MKMKARKIYGRRKGSRINRVAVAEKKLKGSGINRVAVAEKKLNSPNKLGYWRKCGGFMGARFFV